MDRTAFGHFEIDRVAIATRVAVFSMKALADRERLSGRVGELIHKCIVVFDAEAPPGGVVGIGPTGILLGVFGANGKGGDFLARRDSGGEWNRGGRFEILQLHVDRDGNGSELEVFDEELCFAVLFLAGNANELLFGAQESARDEAEREGKRYYAP